MIDGRSDGSLDGSLNFDAVGDLLCDGAFGRKSDGSLEGSTKAVTDDEAGLRSRWSFGNKECRCTWWYSRFCNTLGGRDAGNNVGDLDFAIHCLLGSRLDYCWSCGRFTFWFAGWTSP